jgi:hypothetical protein
VQIAIAITALEFLSVLAGLAILAIFTQVLIWSCPRTETTITGSIRCQDRQHRHDHQEYRLRRVGAFPNYRLCALAPNSE